MKYSTFMLMRMVSMSMSNTLNAVIWLIAISGIAITIRLIVNITASELLIPHTCINTCEETKMISFSIFQ